MTVSFKIYQVKNKAEQQAYVYMGKPRLDAVAAESFYPHMESAKCEDVYLFTTLVGSKNIRLTPSTLTPRGAEDNNEILKDPFIHIDTRWYHFRYPGRENDNTLNLPPNDFVKTHFGSRGDYTVEWRKLTSDGSVLIKPSLSSTVFWNGKNYISNSEAGYSEAPFSENMLDDDLIYLKTRHYIEVIRNTVKSNSLSVVYKKYIDECKWKSTYLLKRFRGSYCVDVKEAGSSINVGVKETENKECECGCITCWEIVNGEAILKYSKLDMQNPIKDEIEEFEQDRINLINLWESYKVHTTDPENTTPVTMTWLEQFEYNILNNMGYNRFEQFPLVVTDEKTVDVKFNRYSDRQNRFYGISPRTATREHHAMPCVGKPMDDAPHIYSYTNTHSLFHPDFYMESMSGYYDRYATTPTKIITKGRIDDGKERVVVPPGVIFRTYKAVPGILSLYELDTPYRRPDEYHFAVDGYGNILGYKSLPFPGLLHTEYPLEASGLRTTAVDDVDMRSNITQAWNCYFDSGKTEFCEDTIDEIHRHRIENNYYTFTKTLNYKEQVGIDSCEYMTGTSTATSADDVWSISANMSTHKKFHSSVKLSDNRILVTGGYEVPDRILSSCEIYDPSTDTFTPVASMNYRRYGHTSTLLTTNGNVIVIGGYNEEGTLNRVEIYDPLLDTWTEVASCRYNRQFHTANFIDGNVLIVGGYRNDSVCRNTNTNSYIKTCEIYDPILNKWSVVGDLTSPRIDHSSTVFVNGGYDKVLIYGGYDGFNLVDTYSIYDSNTQDITNYSTVVPKRRKHTAETIDPGDRILLIGGYDDTGALSTCDIFTSSLSVFPTSNMSEARFGHSSISIGGNKIHVTGGYDFISYKSSTEMFDVSSLLWTPSNIMTVNRYNHTSHYDNIGDTTICIGGFSEAEIYPEMISGGATHTYVNIHHCPIWIDKDIFCSYYFVENPKRFDENDYNKDCGIVISCESSSSSNAESSSSSSSSSSSGEVSSSSQDKVTIIEVDLFENDVPDIPPAQASSSSSIDEVSVARPPVSYSDDIITVNSVHGFVDVNEAGTYSFTVPSGVNRLKIMAWGAGGGGGGYAHIDVTNLDKEHSITKSSGGGGGAGGYVKTIRNVTPSTTITYVVGGGGDTGESVTINGKTNTDGSISWFDANLNLVAEPHIIKGVNGGNGGNSTVYGITAYGGRGGIAGTVQRGNGLAGIGGNGSSGGTATSLVGLDVYGGQSGEDGESIYEGNKGPVMFGGTHGFPQNPSGGLCLIPGAGNGGDGHKNHTESILGGQDGRVRIEW